MRINRTFRRDEPESYDDGTKFHRTAVMTRTLHNIVEYVLYVA